MVRTQIYLTERQRHELAAIAYTVWKKQSELIREAVDRLIKEEASGKRERLYCAKLPGSGKIARIFPISEQLVPNGIGADHG